MHRRPILAALTALALLALPAPVRASDFLVASTVGAGGYHSCALTRGGEAFCWGANGSGELGDGTVIPSGAAGPRKVIGGLRFRSLSVGKYTTCGITTRAEAYCWGFNQFGQLGDGTVVDSGANGPQKVIGGHRWRSISIDLFHACGITMRGDTYCWGWNTYGQVGDGTTSDTLQAGPQRVIGGIRFASIDTDGFTTCGLTTRGDAYCWGWNEWGQLGDGTIDDSLRRGPRRVIGGHRFTQISAGFQQTCGITPIGEAYCWGINYYGELGDGTLTLSGVKGPQPVIGGLRFASIDAGYLFGCGLTLTGEAYCWGDNSFGKLGDGTTVGTGAGGPRPVIGGLRFAELRAGWYHTCGMTPQGEVYCWGSNASGQLGDGTVVDSGAYGPQRVIAGAA